MRRLLIFALCFFLTACGTLTPPLTATRPASVTEGVSSPEPQTATPPAAPHILRIWLPPQFNPDAETPAAKVLKARLDAFAQSHLDLSLDLRIKGNDDVSLLEILSLTHSAAPNALPDLVALPRADLEAAAIKGFIHPLTGLTDLLNDPDWYSYARQLGHVQNAAYGLPFAGDALAIAYHPSEFNEPPVTWEDLFLQQRYLAILKDDPNSLLQLSLYLSAGKPLLDETNHPSLDEVTLTDAFQKLVDARFIAAQSEDAALEAFTDGRADLCLIWTSRFIRDPQPDTALLPFPGLEGTPFTLATSWAWALAGEDPQNELLAAELAEWLAADDFLTEWDQAAGYLSPRPNALQAWDAQSSLDMISQSAQVLPSNDLLSALGPVLQEALSRILNGEQAEVVARSVVEALK